MGRRVRWVGVVLILCFGLVIAQLVNIQFHRAGALNAMATNPRNIATHLDNQRGQILAADGTVLAKSVPTNAGTGQYKYQRVYPTATANLFASVVGYDSFTYGTSGVEYQYDQYLTAHTQTAQSLSQALGLDPLPKTTDTVSLTLQPKLQAVAAQALASVPTANKDGAVVAIQPSTGAIEAMYSNPTFDPNQFASLSASTQQAAWTAYNTKDSENFEAALPLATAERFQPGSTSKVVTSLAAYNLEPKLSNYSAPVQLCLNLPGSDKPLCNDDGPCGGTMIEMLPPSCDPGYASLAYALTPGLLSQQGALFGYNTVPPIDLPNVIASTFPTAQQLTTSGQYGEPGVGYAAIGQQSVFATPLQNALVAAAVANGGLEMVPHVMSQIRDSQGNLVRSYQPTVWHRAVSQTAAQQVTTLMQAVTQPGGTAAGIFPASWNVAAKTGTAQIGNNQNEDWMIAFAPAVNPVIAVAVVLPYQAKESDGAGIAGPVMRDVLAEALSLSASTAGTTTSTSTTTTTTFHTTTGARAATTTTAPAATTTTAPATTTTTAPAATTTTAPATTTTAAPPATTTPTG